MVDLRVDVIAKRIAKSINVDWSDIPEIDVLRMDERSCSKDIVYSRSHFRRIACSVLDLYNEKSLSFSNDNSFIVENIARIVSDLYIKNMSIEDSKELTDLIEEYLNDQDTNFPIQPCVFCKHFNHYNTTCLRRKIVDPINGLQSIPKYARSERSASWFGFDKCGPNGRYWKSNK